MNQIIKECHQVFKYIYIIDFIFYNIVGNGYLSTVINSNEIFIAGVYNGFAISKKPSHRYYYNNKKYIFFN